MRSAEQPTAGSSSFPVSVMQSAHTSQHTGAALRISGSAASDCCGTLQPPLTRTSPSLASTGSKRGIMRLKTWLDFAEAVWSPAPSFYAPS